MPVTIKTQVGYVRNENGSYSSFNSFGESPSNSMELIESITLSNQQDSIIKTVYPDGTPYKLTNAMVFVYIPAASRTGTTIPRARGIINENPIGYINSRTLGNDAFYCYWKIDVFSKLYMIQSFSGAYNDTITPANTRWPQSIDTDYIEGIEVYLYTTAGMKYPVGTKIDIFGTKA